MVVVGGSKSPTTVLMFRIMITMKGEEVLAADESGDSDKWIEMQTLTVGEGGFSV